MTTAQALRYVKIILTNVEGISKESVKEPIDVIERAIYFQRTQCMLDVAQDLLKQISQSDMNKRDIKKYLENCIKDYNCRLYNGELYEH